LLKHKTNNIGHDLCLHEQPSENATCK